MASEARRTGADPRLPNFFILGAARCGTTALYRALAQHPQVYLPTIKEPTFFSEPFQVIGNPIAYASLYRHVKHELAIGDASHAYLTHPYAPRTIRAFFPHARFIITLRNPAERALSLYLVMVRKRYEWHSTLEAALRAESRRFASQRFAARCRGYFWNYMYYRSGLFGEQIQRYLDLFPSNRFLFTTMYDLAREPAKVMERIERFLGVGLRPAEDVDQYALNEVESRNPVARQPGFPPFQFLKHRLGETGFGRVVRNMRGTENAVDSSAHLDRTGPPPVHPKTLTRLLDKYQADLTRVTNLTGIDVIATQSASCPTVGVCD